VPTINISLKELNLLVGKKLSEKELDYFLSCAKAELEKRIGDELIIKLNDTNLPYLWSSEGLARLFKGLLGKKIKRLVVKKTNKRIIVDEDITAIRPYIGAFTASGKQVTKELLKQIIQLQEKLADCYGRKREKLAIGVYSSKRIKFPVRYKAVSTNYEFVPLGFEERMSLKRILKEHPKGIEYAGLLKDFNKYPILVDDNNETLSFPPIINSNFSGKVEVGDSELLIEATGDLRIVNLAINIFATALSDRGFKIGAIEIVYPKVKKRTPEMNEEKVTVSTDNVERIFGLKLNVNETKNLLKKMGYDCKVKNKQLLVIVPNYRDDIMHNVDIVEDIGIAYGYEKIQKEKLKTYTIGGTFQINDFVDNMREILIGFSYQEVYSPILTNKELLYEKMNIKDFGTIEIENIMSETYAVVRTWLLPLLMDFLSKNKTASYPQKVFEQGLVTIKEKDYEKVALISIHKDANYTEMRQILDAILCVFGVKSEIKELEHGSFITGRTGKILVNGKEIGIIGEMHPRTLINFYLQLPVVAMELNLSLLYELVENAKRQNLSTCQKDSKR